MKKKLIFLLSFSFVLMGCSFSLNDSSLNEMVENYTKVNSTKETAKIKATQVSEEESENWQEYDEDIVDTSNYVVRYMKYEAVGGIEELCTYGQNDEILYPGAVVDIANPTIGVINLKQSPITMSIGLEGTSNNESYRPYVMSDPCLSNARLGVNKLVSNSLNKLTGYPTKYSLNTHNVTNSMEMKIALGLNVDYSGVKIGTDFNYSTSTTSTSLVLVIKQIYYTIDIDVKKGASSYFSSSESAEHCKKELEGKIPAVVSSVSYGRIAIVKLSSNSSLSSYDIGLNGGYLTAVDASVKIDNKIEKGEIKSEVFVYGGSLSSDTVIGATTDLETIIKEFNKDIDPEVARAVPISYRFRHISDNSEAKVMMSNEPIYVKQYVLKKVAYQLRLRELELMFDNSEPAIQSALVNNELIFRGVEISAYATTATITSSDITSKSETATYKSSSTLPFDDNKIKFDNSASMIIKNVDNEKISSGELLTLNLEGVVTLKIDCDNNAWGDIVSFFTYGMSNFVTGVVKNANEKEIDIKFNMRQENYSDILASEGITVNTSNGDITVEMFFEVIPML